MMILAPAIPVWPTLKHFPIDNLKIDQSFVLGLEQDPVNQAILKAIVVLGHNLGLNVIAEGSKLRGNVNS